jgi:NAD(P)-dependent dehydrogenase (short-subunit alcohol dehydrogenase family)
VAEPRDAPPVTGRVAGKKALVTGAAQGLGAAAATQLAREGATVLLTDINEAGAAAVAEAINRELGRTVAWSCRHDVTSEGEWGAAVARAEEKLGGLSVLVHNAGIVITGSVEALSLDEWRRGMAVNVDSIFLGTQYALPLMRAHQPGSIIIVSSISGLIAAHNFANYNASKAGAWLLGKSIALHCAREGLDIRCNSIHPAFIETPILKDVIGDRDEAATLARMEKQIPLRRLGQPDDVAQAVVYLASDESRFMTGAEIKLDGGISAM